jgi:Acyl-[acyl carrier protein]--UDP-N-acetylglucosamine O-acyltransferase
MSDVEIHPTAIVDSTAELGAGTIVGPYCIIASDVVLGEKCWLQNHVTLAGPMRADARIDFMPIVRSASKHRI